MEYNFKTKTCRTQRKAVNLCITKKEIDMKKKKCEKNKKISC